MIRYLVARVVGGGVESHFVVEAEHQGMLAKELASRYPDEEVRLEGYNFWYVTNMAHYAAASYPDSNFVNNYQTLRAPAHFNRPFFHVLKASEFSTRPSANGN